MNTSPTLLRRAFDTWLAAESLRRARLRYKRFTYGDQWADPSDDPTFPGISEREVLALRRQRPVTNNMVRQLVKTVVGRYRATAAETGRYSSDPDSLDARNSLPELDARMLEEFVISGCAVQRVVAERRPQGVGVWVDNVDPRLFFVNAYSDPRGHDIDFIGQLHDLSWTELANRFGRGSRRHAESLRRLFSSPPADSFFDTPPDLGMASSADPDFFCPRSPGRFRVVEIWTLEPRPEQRRGSFRLEPVWRCRWLAPDGSVLDEYASPFAHGSHPFVVALYPLTDGEVHSFVEDVVDQQKAINRILVMLDTMMATAAKGALIFPLDQLPRGLELHDVAKMWSNPQAVIPVNGRGMALPQQIHSNPADSGATQLLDLQMRLFQHTSGLSDALMGRNVSPATGSSLYQAQVENASYALTDILHTFTAFTERRSAKAENTLASLT